MKLAKLKEESYIKDLISNSYDAYIKFDKPLVNNKDKILSIFKNLDNKAVVEKNGAPSIAIIENWIEQEEFVESINLYMLHNAYVFGGNITDRKGWFHYNGQLILTSNKELISASFGVMDGHKSLSGDCIGGQYTGKDIDDCFLKIDLNCNSSKGWYYFIGNSHRHFGHFILEGLSRLWALVFIPSEIRDNLFFIIYEDNMKSFMIELFNLLGINTSKIVSASKCSQYENIIVPDTSFRTHRWVSPSFRNHINVIKSRIVIKSRNRKIFLSRKNIPDRPLINRELIEQQFKDNGYEIVSPENLSITEQIRLVMESTDIAGEVGSQLYLLIFAESSTNVFVMAPNNFYLKDDYLISNLNNLNLSVILGSSIDFTITKKERSWIVDSDCITNYLNQFTI